MQRVRLQLPERFDFSCYIPIRITDLNYGGHVGNDTVLSLLHEARLQYFTDYNYSELNFGGVSIIMTDVAIQFKNELFYGDLVRAWVQVGEFSSLGFELFYKLEKEKDGKVFPVVFAKTGMVCFDYHQKKPVPVPEEVKERLKMAVKR